MATLAETLAEVEETLRDGRTESLLREWGAAFELNPAFPIAKIDLDGPQVRALQHRAPREMVEQYAQQMKAGALFPPLVLTRSGGLIDGNTRLGAHRKLGHQTVPAYLVKVPRLDFAIMLGAGLNQLGGLRLTREEQVQAAERMMGENWTDEAIARAIGISGSKVRGFRKERRYSEAAERLGLLDLELPSTVRQQLADIGHDAPLESAARLVAKANAALPEVKELVRSISEARSEQGELDAVGTFRDRWQAPAAPPAGRPRTPDVVAMRAKRTLEKLLDSGATTEQLAPASLRAELEPVWRRTRDLADGVLAVLAATSES